MHLFQIGRALSVPFDQLGRYAEATSNEETCLTMGTPNMDFIRTYAQRPAKQVDIRGKSQSDHTLHITSWGRQGAAVV